MTFTSALPTIALITDFGCKDGFCGVMKGVIYRTLQSGKHLPTQQPIPPLVDITHEIPPFSIREGAWVLGNCHNEFPDYTVFVCVVDPHVGKEEQRKLLLYWPERKHYFIGPDNGIFTPIIKATGSELQAYAIDNPQLYRQCRLSDAPHVSQTFHGRDIYAPVAGHLAHALMTYQAEELLQTVGHRIAPQELTAISWFYPKHNGETLEGEVIHIDRFGNITTNIPSEWMADTQELEVCLELSENNKQHCWHGEHLNSYADGEGFEDVFVVAGSSGTMELALYRQNASRVLSVSVGDPIVLRPLSKAKRRKQGRQLPTGFVDLK